MYDVLPFILRLPITVNHMGSWVHHLSSYDSTLKAMALGWTVGAYLPTCLTTHVLIIPLIFTLARLFQASTAWY